MMMNGNPNFIQLDWSKCIFCTFNCLEQPEFNNVKKVEMKNILFGKHCKVKLLYLLCLTIKNDKECLFCRKSGGTMFSCGCSSPHHVFCILQPPSANDEIPPKNTTIAAYCAKAAKVVILPQRSLMSAFKNAQAEVKEMKIITSAKCLQRFLFIL